MSNKVEQKEELTKSIDTLIDEVFSEEVSKGMALDLAEDNKTTADAAVSKAPSMQKDEARGAGRPKQISDVPQVDMDGRRGSDYDDAIAEAEKDSGDEPAEAKQSPAIDQVSDKGHMKDGSKAPKMAPFKKSEEISDEEYAEFVAFKKSKAEAAEKAQKQEELKKAEVAKKEQEDLVKSAVAAATAEVTRKYNELRKSFDESNALIKAMASQPVRAKSITGIEALEKSENKENKEPESFSKSEVLDAAFELAKAGKIPVDAVSEIEMTNRCADAEVRSKIEKYLEGKN